MDLDTKVSEWLQSSGYLADRYEERNITYEFGVRFSADYTIRDSDGTDKDLKVFAYKFPDGAIRVDVYVRNETKIILK